MAPATGAPRGAGWEVDATVGRFGSCEELAWLGAHGRHADSVELKALLEPPAASAAEALTGRCKPTWSVRQMYLLDTPDLDLLRAGVEIRLRRRARSRFDLAVSVRRSLTARERATPRGVRVEVDVVPGAAWQDVEVRREIDAATAADVVAGLTAPQDLLSMPQRSWARRGGTSLVDDARLEGLAVHGPLVVNRVKVASSGVGLSRTDLEHFRYPSGRELVELSTRCGPEDVSTTASAFERLLDERDVAVASVYRTKTAMWQAEIVGGSAR